jgi:twitching motility protein PilT
MSQLADILLGSGLLDEQQLSVAVARAEASGTPLVRAVVDLGVMSEQQVVASIAEYVGLPYADLTVDHIDPSAAVLVTVGLALELMALPVAFSDGGELVVAIADPGNVSALDTITQITGLPARPALGVGADLRRAITNMADGAGLQSSEEVVAEVVASDEGAQDEIDPEQLVYEQRQRIDLNDALIELVKRGGSDLHLTAGLPPMIRMNGQLERMDEFPTMNSRDIQQMIYGLLTQRQREEFENHLELDCSYAIPSVARFRVNVFQQRDSMGSVMRIIPFEIKSIEDLGVPSQVSNFAYLPRGFVLVTGPTGSGKSTTLAALIDVINRERASHIMTVEDPIEFLHEHKRSVVNQRELGTDTHSFAAALKHVLRQDPDVILVGEMRDLETIQVALTAAETGHLVFGTLHTQDAPQTVDRVIDVFPPHQQEQIRVMLGGALQGVVCQQLLKTADGKGRVAACEVMIATPAIKNLIREGKTHQMYSSIQAGKQFGMVTMDQSLADMVIKGKVTYDAALEKCSNIPDFNRLCGRA